MNRPAVPLVGAVVGVAAFVAIAAATAPSAAPADLASAERRPVVGRLAVCPELLRAGGDVETKLTVGAAQPGEVEVYAASVVPGAGLGPRVLDGGERVGSFGLPGNTAVAVAATARGGLAGAVEAEQVSRGDIGRQRGLAGTRCESTSPDTWFIGGATKIGVETELVLVNPYDDEAQVDVHLLGTNGPIDAPDGEGKVIKARQRLVVKLAELAPDEQAIAVHVTTRAGRVSPAIRDARSNVNTPNGVDWVPRSGPPATVVNLAGVPSGNGRRLLYLAAPGEDDANVSVTVTTKDNQFVPAEMDDVTLLAGRVAWLDLTEALAGETASIRVSSENEQPFLASVLVENHANFNQRREIAYVGTTQPLSGPALVTDARVGKDLDTQIVLSAPDGDGRVSIGLVPLIGQTVPVPAPAIVELPAGKLVVFELSRFKLGVNTSARAVIVTPLPGSAPVYGARLISETALLGPMFTVLALQTQPVSGVPAPAVVRDPTVSLVDPRQAPAVPE